MCYHLFATTRPRKQAELDAQKVPSTFKQTYGYAHRA
jgi:hypothetical protein